MRVKTISASYRVLQKLKNTLAMFSNYLIPISFICMLPFAFCPSLYPFYYLATLYFFLSKFHDLQSVLVAPICTAKLFVFVLVYGRNSFLIWLAPERVVERGTVAKMWYGQMIIDYKIWICSDQLKEKREVRLPAEYSKTKNSLLVIAIHMH